LNKAKTVEIQRLKCPACAAYLIIDEDGTVTAHAEEPTPVETTDETTTEQDSSEVETQDDPQGTTKKRSSKWSKKKE